MGNLNNKVEYVIFHQGNLIYTSKNFNASCKKYHSLASRNSCHKLLEVRKDKDNNVKELIIIFHSEPYL
jgi:hypothetical protein